MENQTLFHPRNMLHSQFVNQAVQKRTPSRFQHNSCSERRSSHQNQETEISNISKKYSHWNRGKGKSTRETLKQCEQVHRNNPKGHRRKAMA